VGIIAAEPGSLGNVSPGHWSGDGAALLQLFRGQRVTTAGGTDRWINYSPPKTETV